ncbi:putative lipoprotein [Bacillus freudenreichii]|nr:putative lipoprotein [Bacillus freudenreichii]
MKFKLWPIVIGMLVLILAACGKAGNEESEDDIPKPLDVELELQETADVNEAVPFKAIVTQGDEKIKDADEVEFEVWEEGKKEDSEMIEAKNNNDGTYEAEKSFDTDGVYTVQVHVTARGLHTMPKKTVRVGDGATAKGERGHHHGGHGHHHGENDEHHHAEGFGMHFVNPKGLEAGKNAELMVHLQKDDHPMEHARVSFEIWNDASEKHEFVDAKELKPGEYTCHYDFEKAGMYKVQVHVEDDNGLHEHEEHQIKVK